MISAFSCQNSLICFTLYSKAKFACYSRCFFTSYFCIPAPYNDKAIFFWVLVLEGLVGLHRTIQLQLLQHYWSGHRLGLPWYWMVCLGNEQRSFCRFWDCIQVLRFGLFCWLWGLLHFFQGILASYYKSLQIPHCFPDAPTHCLVYLRISNSFQVLLCAIIKTNWDGSLAHKDAPTPIVSRPPCHTHSFCKRWQTHKVVPPTVSQHWFPCPSSRTERMI